MKDTNTTLIVGLACLVVVASVTMMTIAFSRTDPVIIIGFAGTIVAGIFAFLRAGQAADEASRAKREAAELAITSADNTQKIQELKVTINGRMEDLIRVSKENATLIEQKLGIERAQEVKKASDEALQIAQASIPAPTQQPEATQQTEEPEEVTIVQPPDLPVPVAFPTPLPVEVEGHQN